MTGEQHQGQPAPEQPTKEPAGTERAPAARRGGPRRTRRRLVIGGVLLAVLGGGLAAWQTEALPAPSFLADEERVCWESLGPDDVRELLGGMELLDVDEIRPASGTSGYFGLCRLVTEWTTIDIRVTELEDRDFGVHDDGLSWVTGPALNRMTPLGHPSPGMASASAAWQTLPDGCRSASNGYRTVELLWSETSADTGDAAANARAVTKVTNGLMAARGCTGELPLPAPPEQPETATETSPEWTEAFCGIPGFAPESEIPGSEYAVMPLLDTPIRVCSLGVDGYTADQHDTTLTTVSDPYLADHLSPWPFRPVEQLTGTTGRGGLRGDTLYYRAECPTGYVLFVAKNQRHQGGALDIEELFLEYVDAETERLGCLDQDVAWTPPEEVPDDES